MKDRTDKLQELLTQALECADAEERSDYLSRACGNDRRLLEEVEELVEAHHSSEKFLHADPRNQGAGLMGAADGSLGEGVGTLIGRYKLLEQIGEGGFGVVYAAEQQEPVRRRVALKIIKAGMDTRQVIARFEAERQALAMMDHPNIAKVFDAGSTETGRPYFVMELVRGIPITQFCEENRLTIKERLHLFIPVCQAIQHAHQKGVIHRDIKPSNVLVTMNEGVPHPMVIDFGVAKAIDRRLTEKTLYTNFAQMIGTPAYMAPEQAEMSKQDVDTRSDVYSLGVMLYELLTGTTPFSEERLREAGFAEIQRIITQEEPVRPSTLVSRMNGKLRAIATNRQSEPTSLIKRIKGDLDWIVLKAIEKDRNRRYETANGLAADLQRHLSDEPVLARAPGGLYRFTKLVRRHRGIAAASAAITLALAVGLTLAFVESLRATRERERAEEFALKTLESKSETDAINQWLQELIGALLPIRDVTSHASPSTLTLKEAVSFAAKNLDQRFEGYPTTEAKTRLIVGQALAAQGSYEEAAIHLRRAYDLYLETSGPMDTNSLTAQEQLGLCLVSATLLARTREHVSLRAEGRQLVEDAYDARVRLFGLDDPFTLQGALELGLQLINETKLGRADRLITRSVLVSRGQAEQPGTFTRAFRVRAKCALALLREAQGRLEEARGLWRELVDQLGLLSHSNKHVLPNGLTAATVTGQWAKYVWTWDRNHEEAAALYSRAVETSMARVGYGSPTPTLLYQLSKVYQDQQRFPEAIRIRKQRYQGLRQSYADGHPMVCNDAREVAALYAGQADWQAALAWQEDQRRQGNADDLSVVFELYTRHMADRTRDASDLRRLFWRYFEQQPQVAAEFPNAYVLLTLPCPAQERGLLQQFTREAVAKLRRDPQYASYRTLLIALIQGMEAYWEERFESCISQLRPVLKVFGDRSLAALAGFYVAMAQKRTGEDSAARLSLADSSQLLDAVLQLGDLNPRPTPFRPLRLNSACLMARDEAETLIHGQVISEPVTKESMQRARAAWKAIHDLLQEAHETARDRRYTAARDQYLEVMDDDRFNWESARHAFAEFDAELAVVFALAGDKEHFQQLWKDFGDAQLRFSTPRAACLFPDVRPDCLVALWREGLQKTTEENLEATAGERGRSDYDLLDYGVIQLRMGQPQQALEALEVASHSEKWLCSVEAKAFGAIAAQQVGDMEQAVSWFTQADQAWNEMIRAGESRLQPAFHDQGIVELALKEGRVQLLGSNSSAPELSER